MRFTKPDKLTVWESGGDIMCRNGRMTRTDASAFYDFLAGQAALTHEAGDGAAAKYLAHIAIQVFTAISASDRWARAGMVRSAAA